MGSESAFSRCDSRLGGVGGRKPEAELGRIGLHKGVLLHNFFRDKLRGFGAQIDAGGPCGDAGSRVFRGSLRLCAQLQFSA